MAGSVVSEHDDLWARGEARIREALAAVEREARVSIPDLSIRIRSSRDPRDRLHLVAELWEGPGYELVFSVLFTGPPGPRGPLVRDLKLKDSASSGFLMERPESPMPESLGMAPTEHEINESIEEVVAFARRCGEILVSERLAEKGL
jgi:hypothetical protein